MCTTCVRDAGPGDERGRRLAEGLEAGIRARGLGFTVREVACLNGCRSPCNVALRGAKRWTYRFSRCSVDDVEALLVAAADYWATPRGRIARDAWPSSLRDKLSACTPPPT